MCNAYAFTNQTSVWILGIDLLLEGAAGGLTAVQSDLLSTCQEDCERLEKLMRDLLDLTRIEAGENPPHLVLINATTLLHEVAEALRAQVEANGLTFTVDVPLGLPCVRADHLQIERVIANLVTNAIRHTPRAGEIHITAADRISSQVQTARLSETRTQTWPTNERLLVCVGASPTSAKVIRTAKRMAAAMHAQWIAMHVETATAQKMHAQAQHRLALHMRLAEQLGAETVTLTGQDVVAEIVAYAQSRNVTKIVIGKTGPVTEWRFWRRSIVNRLVAQSHNIDVYVIQGAAEHLTAGALAVSRAIGYRRYVVAAMVMAATTAIAWAFYTLGLTDADLVMLLLLGVVFVAARLGRGPAICASIAAVLLFNFFFTHPRYTFAVNDTKYLSTFAVMLIVAVIIGALTSRIRDQVERSRQRERPTEALYRLSRRLASTSGSHQLVAAAETQLAEIFGGEVVIFLPDLSKSLRPVLSRGQGFAERPTEVAVAAWVYERGQLAGAGTDTLPSAQALYLPLVNPEGTVGVLAIRPTDVERLLTTDQRQFALALAHDRFAEEAQHALAQIEAEQLRSSLLSTVSHDLRTPLAAIAGASSSLLTAKSLDTETRDALLQTIYDRPSACHVWSRTCSP